MKKRYVSIMIALTLALTGTLTGCGGVSPAKPQRDGSKPSVSSAVSSSEVSSAALESVESSSSAAESSAASSETVSSEAASSEAASSSEESSAAESTAADTSKPDPKYAYQKKDDGSIAMNYGAILHAFCWDFKTITANLQDIKDAGYTSIQTSPINECKVGENGGMSIQSEDDSGKWYYHYQPTDYVIGNYQLGTEEEFKTLCKEAEKIGLKIIVDVPLNHTTSDESVISENIMNICKEPFHNRGEIASYASRKQVTQNDLLGLKDLNTQDKDVQNYLLAYLKNCVADGASGFRYDAAKHIELPDDDPAYASDFWPTIIDNGAEFQYGEILRGDNDRLEDYAKFINVTASAYGERMRGAAKGVLSTGAVESFTVGSVDPSKLVTWVESHDNYCNDGEDSWYNMNESEVEFGWAIIAARSGGAPLFFSRPHGSTQEDPWGDNVIGKAGSDGYKSANVSALNHFRNDMAGLGEKLTNPDDNDKVLMIERGNKGAVILNMTDKEFDLKDTESVLADGTYKDKVTSAEFTVAGGKISGKVPSMGIIVIY